MARLLRTALPPAGLLTLSVLALAGASEELGEKPPPGARLRFGVGARGREKEVFALAFSPDGKRLAAADRAGTVRLWDPATGKETGTLKGHAGPVRALAFTPDGKALASGGDDCTVRLWEAAPGKQLRQFAGNQLAVLAVAFSPDGSLLAVAGLENLVRILDAGGNRELRQLAREGNAFYLAFSPDGRLLATCSWTGPVRVWESGPAREFRHFAREEGGYTAGLAYAPDGKTVATAHADGLVCLWEVATGKERGRIAAHKDEVDSLAFSPDGKLLVSGGRDKLVVLHRLPAGRGRHELKGHADLVTAVAFAPDGKGVASAGKDGELLLWDVPALRPAAAKRTAKELDALWADLAGDDAVKAYEAITALVAAAPESVAFLRERLKPVEVDPKRLAQLVADLDSDDFDARQQADAELEKLGQEAEPALRRALAGKPSLEVHRRVERLLGLCERQKPGPERLRQLRAFEVLERLDTPEARRLLTTLAELPSQLLLGVEAREALRRLDPQADKRSPRSQEK